MSTKKQPKIANCQNPACNVEFIVKAGSAGKYCGSSCAAKINNSRRIVKDSSNTKRSNTIKEGIKTGRIKKPNFPSVKGLRWAKENRDDWLKYKQSCSFYTPYHLWPYIDGYNLLQKIGWFNPISNKHGVVRDHMFSIKEGWEQNIPSCLIKHPANCNFITFKENNIKSKKCSITYKELLYRINTWKLLEESNLVPSILL